MCCWQFSYNQQCANNNNNGILFPRGKLEKLSRGPRPSHTHHLSSSYSCLTNPLAQGSTIESSICSVFILINISCSGCEAQSWHLNTFAATHLLQNSIRCNNCKRTSKRYKQFRCTHSFILPVNDDPSNYFRFIDHKLKYHLCVAWARINIVQNYDHYFTISRSSSILLLHVVMDATNSTVKKSEAPPKAIKSAFNR